VLRGGGTRLGLGRPPGRADLLLDLRGACDYADFSVIMTASSTRQLRTLVEDVEQGMKLGGAPLHHVEGGRDSGGVLMDYGDVIVHLLGPDERDFYALETVWPAARPSAGPKGQAKA